MSNYEIIKDILKNKKLEIINPSDFFGKFSKVDAIVLSKKHVSLVYFNKRNIHYRNMIDGFGGESIIEKEKYEEMINLKDFLLKYYPLKDFKIKYITQSKDDYIIHWDITKLTQEWVETRFNNDSYGSQIMYINKLRLLDSKVFKKK